MQRMNISAVRTGANGTPVIARPMPPSTAWASAVTTTPSATPRIAAPPRFTTSSPRGPARRRPNARTPAAAVSPWAYMIAVMTTVSRNCSSAPPSVPASLRNHWAAPPAYGLHARQEPAGAGGHDLVPQFREPVSGERHLGEPCGRRRRARGHQRRDPAGNAVGVVDDRADREHERHDEHQQHQRRHRGHGQPAAPAQPGLQPDQDGPRGDDDHRRPDRRREERPHDPERGERQCADPGNAEGDAGEVAARIGHGVPTAYTSTGAEIPFNATGPSDSTSVRSEREERVALSIRMARCAILVCVSSRDGEIDDLADARVRRPVVGAGVAGDHLAGGDADADPDLAACPRRPARG